MDLGLKEYSQLFALSLKEKGKNLRRVKSRALVWLVKVATTSSNSLMCKYGFSFSRPWNVGRSWIMLDLKSIWGVLARNMIHEGVAIQVGCK